ncbi:hypothetical protein [Streptomyces cavernae]|uniref:hypothetical protein n=1 Tax=Streptomyces cavernae TaxID=2259034 RepID=UPI000FEB6919|nr:hypothetical protein [Streptomyces cavernae]
MTRRVLGMGPTEQSTAAECAGSRLLPVERLLDPEGGREAAEGEQQPQTEVRRLRRRRPSVPGGA